MSLSEYFRIDQRIRAGVLWSSFAPSRDLTPESLRGSHYRDLTLGITRGACTAPVGLHRFEPVVGLESLPPRAMFLPDKEFRYLRTVIVTAAVYRGFSSELWLAPNPSL